MTTTAYAFELPTTGTFSFAEHFSSPHSTAPAALAAATQARASVRALLKESKRTDGDKDYLRLVKTLEDYLPHLYGVLASVKSGDLVEKQRPIFSWRTTLSAHLFASSPRLSLPDLASEHTFTLLTYAAALTNLARLTVSALGAYERDRALPDAERRARDDRLGFAVGLLCRAAGVYAYVADTVLVDALPLPAGIARPPELSKEVASALSKLALSSAQSLAIRKLLSKAAADAALAPGPPLPRSHPSPALLAKLHLDAAELCTSAHALLRMPGASRARLKSRSASGAHSHFSLAKLKDKAKLKGKDKGKSKGGDKNEDEGESASEDEDAPQPTGGSSAAADDNDATEVSTDLLRYTSDASTQHAALAYKWLGVDAGETDIHTRGGTAVGFLAWSQRLLAAAAGDRKRDDKKKGAGAEDDAAAVGAFLRHYKKLNDTLAYCPVPSQAELQASIPTGRMAVSVRIFEPPAPAFALDTTGDEQAAPMGTGDDGGGSGGNSGSGGGGGPAYAGRGSYF